MAALRRKLLAVALATGLAVATAAPAGAQATWTLIPSPNSPGSNELLGAGAAADSHVWAVGRVLDFDSGPTTYRSLILRWNGNAWASAPHPSFATNHTLDDVDAPATNDAWAVGSRLTRNGAPRVLVEQWDGTRWRLAGPSPEVRGHLSGVKSVPSSPGTIWAVGSSASPGTAIGSAKLILQRTGGIWRQFPTPAVTPTDYLEAVDATGPSNAWAVGWGSTSPFGGTAIGITVRWNGSAWSQVPIPQPSPIMLFGVEALSPTDVWAVGHTYVGGPHWIPLILHWDGATWTRATLPVFPSGGQVRDIVALSPTNIYAVGLDGEGFNAQSLVLHWDGVSWTQQAAPRPRVGPKLYGAAAVSPSTVWGVGYRYDQRANDNQTLTIRTTTG